MAKNFNYVLRPRPGLLVICQTRFEPTLKALAGLGILGMLAWGVYMGEIITSVTSHKPGKRKQLTEGRVQRRSRSFLC